jgi:UrcA family protein
MHTSTASIQTNMLRSGVALTFAIAVLALLSNRAHANDSDVITISVSSVRTGGIVESRPVLLNVGFHPAGVTLTARVQFDPVTLRTNSGVALLNDGVLEGARKLCHAADSTTLDDGTCVREAVESAQPQVKAAIACARLWSMGRCPVAPSSVNN